MVTLVDFRCEMFEKALSVMHGKLCYMQQVTHLHLLVSCGDEGSSGQCWW